MYENAVLFHELVAKNRAVKSARVSSVVAFAALNDGAKLSIANNRNHPVLNSKDLLVATRARDALEYHVNELLPVCNALAVLPISATELKAALNIINSYIYILDATLDHPQNRVVNNYAKAVKARAA